MIYTGPGGWTLWSVFRASDRMLLAAVAAPTVPTAIGMARLDLGLGEVVVHPAREVELFGLASRPASAGYAVQEWLAQVACGQAWEIERLRAELHACERERDVLSDRTGRAESDVMAMRAEASATDRRIRDALGCRADEMPVDAAERLRADVARLKRPKVTALLGPI